MPDQLSSSAREIPAAFEHLCSLLCDSPAPSRLFDQMDQDQRMRYLRLLFVVWSYAESSLQVFGSPDALNLLSRTLEEEVREHLEHAAELKRFSLAKFGNSETPDVPRLSRSARLVG